MSKEREKNIVHSISNEVLDYLYAAGAGNEISKTNSNELFKKEAILILFSGMSHQNQNLLLSLSLNILKEQIEKKR